MLISQDRHFQLLRRRAPRQHESVSHGAALFRLWLTKRVVWAWEDTMVQTTGHALN
jgi:hypothetical protein